LALAAGLKALQFGHISSPFQFWEEKLPMFRNEYFDLRMSFEMAPFDIWSSEVHDVMAASSITRAAF